VIVVSGEGDVVLIRPSRLALGGWVGGVACRRTTTAWRFDPRAVPVPADVMGSEALIDHAQQCGCSLSNLHGQLLLGRRN